MSKGIYDRGYLPHWDFENSLQAITFRLADSVPASVVHKWKLELASSHSDGNLKKAIHARIAHYEDAGHGSSLLMRPDCAEIVQNQLIAGDPEHYKLIDWCIMPNHVHVLIKLYGTTPVGQIVRSWKGASSRFINLLLNRKGNVWQREYYDRLIRDPDHLYDSIAYIRNNPVKAGLCAKPEDWLYSSAGINWQMERRL